MAVFISVQTSAFGELEAETRARQPQINVRRPLRGITIKEDTYAVLRVLTATGEPIPMFDSSSPVVEDGIGKGTHYSNFIVQNVQENRVEKHQVIETFGEDYVYFFGERPRFLTVSGILLNTKDFNWKSEFWENYERYLRGTRLVEQNARLYLYFDDIVVEGYIIQAGTTHQHMSPYHLPFQFTMFVCNYAVLSTVGSVFFQTEAAAALNASGTAVGTGLAPETSEGQAAAAAQAARQGSGGGLNSFLATAGQYATTATFSIQNTLETIKNFFYGRSIVVPEGLGQTLYVPPITNQASFPAPEINQPIHMLNDEYVTRAPTQPRFDDNEIARVEEELALRSPQQLEERARLELAKYGIDTTRRDASYLLLGRGAFAAVQYAGSFGIRQVSGSLPDVIQGATLNL